MKRCFYCHKELEPWRTYCPHCMNRLIPASPKRNRRLFRLLWKPCAIFFAAAVCLAAGLAVGLPRHEPPNLPAAGFEENTAATAVVTRSSAKETRTTASSSSSVAAGTTADSLAPGIMMTASQSTISSTEPPLFSQRTTLAQTLPPSGTQPAYPQVPTEDIRRRVQEKLDFDMTPISESAGLTEARIWYDPEEDVEILVNSIFDNLRICYNNSVFQLPMVYCLRFEGENYVYVGTGYPKASLKTETFDSQACIHAVIANMQQAYPERKFREILGAYIPSYTYIPFSCSAAMSQEEVVEAYTEHLKEITKGTTYEELYVAYLGTKRVVNGISGVTEERHIFASPIP